MEFLPTPLSDPRNFYSKSEGLIHDSRLQRLGGTLMPPNALTEWWQVEDKGYAVIQDKYLGSRRAQVYSIQFKLLDNSLVSRAEEEGTRLETIATWERSVTEIYRKVAKAVYWGQVNPKFHKSLLKFGEYIWPSYRYFLQGELKLILEQGDWGLEQFRTYALAHKKSSSGIHQLKWSSILEKEEILRTIWSELNLVIRSWIQYILNDANFDLLKNSSINPVYTYSALRSRPGAISELTPSEDGWAAIVTKYRDRSAGGILGLSQLNYPIWNSLTYDRIGERMESFLQQLTSLKYHLPTTTGVQHFIDFIKNKQLKDTFDGSAMECQTGLYLRSIFKVDHRIASITLQNEGEEMLSGNPRTPEENEIMSTIAFLAMQECFGLNFKGQEVYCHSDNFSTTFEVPLQEIDDWYSASERYLGIKKNSEHPELSRIGGLRVTVDEKDKVLSVPNNQRALRIENRKISKLRFSQSALINNLLEPFGLSFVQALELAHNEPAYQHGEPIWHLLEEAETTFKEPTLIQRLQEATEKYLIEHPIPQICDTDQVSIRG